MRAFFRRLPRQMILRRHRDPVFRRHTLIQIDGKPIGAGQTGKRSHKRTDRQRDTVSVHLTGDRRILAVQLGLCEGVEIVRHRRRVIRLYLVCDRYRAS